MFCKDPAFGSERGNVIHISTSQSKLCSCINAPKMVSICNYSKQRLNTILLCLLTMNSFEKVVAEKEKIVVTAALPYANGTVHIGHLLEYLQADIYTRFLKSLGKDARYICASDMHGTPIQMKAKENNQDPFDFATKYSKEQQADLALFNINFDNFHNTHSKENKELAIHFFKTLKEKDLIYTKVTEQMFDEEAQQFLPDRFIKGTCPKCQTEDQYGDVCESCGAIYEPADLINPRSAITGATPVLKNTTHYYFKLSKFQDQLQSWLSSEENALQPEVKNFVQGWLSSGLKDWCISRDAPYFGFEIPGSEAETGNIKYFYVWLDAPIGYISSTQNYCDTKLKSLTCSWKDYWVNPGSHVQHFIGKDIMYFHLLFWPAMLMAMEIPLPTVTVHGFITVDGKKMSKSRGTFFTAKEFHNLYGGEALRFYYAKHMDRNLTDINLDFHDFAAVTNNVLVANIGNFCYRTLSFISKRFSEEIAIQEFDSDANEFILKVRSEIEKVTASFANQNNKAAINHILKISDMGNAYFQALAPWKQRETEAEGKKLEQSLILMLNLARNLSILIKPILPKFAAKIERSFGPDNVLANDGAGLLWADLSFSWTGLVKPPERLMEKVEITQTKSSAAAVADKSKSSKSKGSGSSSKIDLNSFAADIRGGEIFNVEDHPNADKLFVLHVNFGESIGKRQIVAGLKSAFTKDQLLQKKALFVVNLLPANIRKVESNGMSLVAEESKDRYNLLWVEDFEIGSSAIFEDKTKIVEKLDFKDFIKFEMEIKNEQVVWNDVVLTCAGQEVKVPGVKDGAKIR